jgi:hypothetical protein
MYAITIPRIKPVVWLCIRLGWEGGHSFHARESCSREFMLFDTYKEANTFKRKNIPVDCVCNIVNVDQCVSLENTSYGVDEYTYLKEVGPPVLCGI